jgi:hypothetical protein
MEKECANCARLSDCHVVSERMIMARGYCDSYEQAAQGTIDARADVIRECGMRALRYALPKPLRDKPKARRRKHV